MRGLTSNLTLSAGKARLVSEFVPRLTARNPNLAERCMTISEDTCKVLATCTSRADLKHMVTEAQIAVNRSPKT